METLSLQSDIISLFGRLGNVDQMKTLSEMINLAKSNQETEEKRKQEEKKLSNAKKLQKIQDDLETVLGGQLRKRITTIYNNKKCCC